MPQYSTLNSADVLLLSCATYYGSALYLGKYIGLVLNVFVRGGGNPESHSLAMFFPNLNRHMQQRNPQGEVGVDGGGVHTTDKTSTPETRLPVLHHMCC